MCKDTNVSRATLDRITGHLQAITDELAQQQDATDQVDIDLTAILRTMPAGPKAPGPAAKPIRRRRQ